MGKSRFQKVYIQRRTAAEWMVFYLILFPFFLGFLQDLVGLSGFIRYTMDLAWFGLVLLSLRKRTWKMNRKWLPLALIVLFFFVYTLLGYLFHFQSVGYYLWGVRNNFRFYVAFFAVVVLFSEEQTESCMRFMYALFWVHIAVSLIQYFVFHYKQDFLGGIFGVERGVNAYSMIFFCVVLCRSILSMMNGDEKLTVCMLRCGAALLVAVLSELFAFFLFFAAILIIATICTKFSWKKCLLYIVIAVFFFFCSIFLVELFGEGSAISLEVIGKRMFAANYATKDDLGRLTAIPTISRKILTDWPSRLFGMGLGNCETSSFEMFTTPFFRSHERLHYVWFLSAFLFLETGYVGLVLYLGFFVLCLILSVREMKNGGNRLYCQMAVIMSVLCMVLTFYNSSLRTEAGYMVFFVLALPFVRRTADRLLK